MKENSSISIFPCAGVSDARKIDFPKLVDHSIRPIGTGSVLAGIGAAALGISPVSHYLIAAGVLFHLTSRFADWWNGHGD